MIQCSPSWDAWNSTLFLGFIVLNDSVLQLWQAKQPMDTPEQDELHPKEVEVQPSPYTMVCGCTGGYDEGDNASKQHWIHIFEWGTKKDGPSLPPTKIFSLPCKIQRHHHPNRRQWRRKHPLSFIDKWRKDIEENWQWSRYDKWQSMAWLWNLPQLSTWWICIDIKDLAW